MLGWFLFFTGSLCMESLGSSPKLLQFQITLFRPCVDIRRGTVLTVEVCFSDRVQQERYVFLFLLVLC
jgi:hypothetical protein